MESDQKYELVMHLGYIVGFNGELSEEGGQLKLTGSVQNADAKNMMWDEIKAVNDGEVPTDLHANIKVDESMPEPWLYHEVSSGETLSKIAQEYLGDAGAFDNIFVINRDSLDDPNMIKVGQVLRVPHAE